jgi:sugar phosphate isomerase/epimerase
MTSAFSVRPLLGAALSLDYVVQHRDWIFDRQRDLELQDFIFADVLNGDWQAIAERARKVLDGHNGRLGIHGPFWGFTISTEDPDVRAVVKRRLLQGLEVCEALGATHMVVHSPYTSWDYNNLDDHPKARGQLIDQAHSALDEAVKRAEDIGCILVIENIEDRDPQARVELARSFDSPSVRVSVDTGHAHYMHRANGAPPVDYYIHAAGKMLEHVHIHDVDGYADRHWLPGEGNICWKPVFDAIATSCERPRLLLEVKDQGNLRKGADYLVDLGLAE